MGLGEERLRYLKRHQGAGGWRVGILPSKHLVLKSTESLQKLDLVLRNRRQQVMRVFEGVLRNSRLRNTDFVH